MQKVARNALREREREAIARAMEDTPDNELFRSDFGVYCSRCRIKTKDRGIIQFDPGVWFEEQRRFNAQRTGRDVVLKSRQIGFTTLELMRGLHQSSTRESWNTLVVGHEHSLVLDLFEHIRFAAEGLAKLYLLPPTRQDTIRQLRFDGIGSQISVTEAGATSAAASKKGHSGTIHRLHCTEVSRWNEPVDTLTGLLGAVPGNGEILFESTANGAGGWFHDTVQECRDGKGPYTFHFYPWFLHAAYRSEIDPDFDPKPQNEYEEALRAAGCDDEQIAWWREKVRDLGMDIALEQYPPNPDLAFRASGRHYFEASTLDTLAHLVRVPLRMVALKWGTSPLGSVVIYAEPVRGAEYVAGADVSEGVGSDAHAAHVLHKKTGEVVATFWSDSISPGDFGLALALIGKMFNMALVAPERNNTGHATIRALQNEARYARIYAGQDGRPGWNTNAASRPVMFDELESACRTKAASMPDQATLGELRTIVVDQDGKPRARGKGRAGGCRDDRVISWAIAWQVRSSGGSNGHAAIGRIREAVNTGGF
jgi:hypothetical protein